MSTDGNLTDISSLLLATFAEMNDFLSFLSRAMRTSSKFPKN